MKDLTNQIMAENLRRAFSKISSAPSQTNITGQGSGRGMSSRNWGFDFYLTPRILEYARWLEYSDEHSNFTYSLKNLHHLIGWIAVVSRRGIGDAEKVVDEILADEWLVDYLADLESNLGFLHAAWRTRELRAMLFGRRIGWYALIRLKRPNFIVETGVDRGLGSAIICRAIMRNAEDGHTGSYLGTDINRDAGVLFSEPLNNLGRIAYGDSVETLRTLSKPIGI